ncbi:hypothetical protein [Litorihabitans aurantiacus]|uniref:hypothetical protein n=1 Tax=Litorihabitans aurantiacus TaxID=1930061 RepID=UPI0024E043CC|nr:hypothetical protein [Litorihabitans aurantiacus]
MTGLLLVGGGACGALLLVRETVPWRRQPMATVVVGATAAVVALVVLAQSAAMSDRPVVATAGTDGPSSVDHTDGQAGGGSPDPRLALDRLLTVADEAIGDAALRPVPLSVEEAECMDGDGVPGRRLELTGQFTAHDLGTARTNGEFLEFTRENEAIAVTITEAWEEAGLLGPAEPLHGEWYQGPTSDGHGSDDVIDLAHVGFAEGVGTLVVTSTCTAL